MNREEKIEYITWIISRNKGIEDHDSFKNKLRELSDKELDIEYDIAGYNYLKMYK